MPLTDPLPTTVPSTALTTGPLATSHGATAPIAAPGGYTQTPTDTAPGTPLPPHETIGQLEFLSAYRAALIEQVAQSAPPLYQGPSSVPTARLRLLKRKPLGAQRLAILAAACGIRGQRAHGDDSGRRRSAGLGLIFEMGTGKTYCALSALAMADEDVTRVSAPVEQRAEKSAFFPAVVLCPPILQEKWAREAEQTLPQARIVILRPISNRAEVAAFRRFDPTFPGGTLSAIGVAERIVCRIGMELASWRAARERALAAGKAAPGKPCHLVVLSQSVAKFGMQWSPVYVLRALRTQDGETGQVRARRDEETGEIATVPCCPRCYAPITEDERHAAARERRARKNAKKRQGPDHDGPQDGRQTNRHASGPGVAATGAVAPMAATIKVIEGDVTDLDDPEVERPYLSEAELLGEVGPRIKRVCAVCGEALWQSLGEGRTWRATHPPLDGQTRALPALPLPTSEYRRLGVLSTASRRYPIADYLRRRHNGFFRSLIADEAHQLKGAGTAQGFAAASLVDACGPQGTALFLTGTLFGGYASDLFPMLWRLMPALRSRFGYDEVARWVRLYGVRQKVTKTDVTPGATGGARSKRKQDQPRFRELPGLSPLALNLLLPHCLFLELADVASDLPPYSEEVITTPLGEDLEPLYRTFERSATDALKNQLRAGDNSGTSSWFHSLMIWPNRPCDAIAAVAKRSGVTLGEAPALSAETVYPKERLLLDRIREEWLEGRRALIFVEHTREHDVLDRLARLIQAEEARWRAEAAEAHTAADHPHLARRSRATPLRIVTLRSETVAPGAREAWLQRTVEQGCDVLLCHSGLVEVGLDLLAFPTIICYEVIFSTSRWRQAVRRSWRPGQTLPVRVAQFTYEQTMEARGLKLIATKALASLLIEGKLPSEGLAAHAETSGTTSLIMELFEQVLDEERQEGHEGIREGIAESVRRAFLNVADGEREAESFIDANGVLESPLDEDDERDDRRALHGKEDLEQQGWLPTPSLASVSLPAPSELVAVSLFDALSEASSQTAEVDVDTPASMVVTSVDGGSEPPSRAPVSPAVEEETVLLLTQVADPPTPPATTPQPRAERSPALSWEEARARQASAFTARRAARPKSPKARQDYALDREQKRRRAQDGEGHETPSLWSAWSSGETEANG